MDQKDQRSHAIDQPLDIMFRRSYNILRSKHKQTSEEDVHQALSKVQLPCVASDVHLMPEPDFLLLEEQDHGATVHGYTFEGDFSGDTWHMSVEEALADAAFQFEDLLGEWKDIPQDIQDPVAYIRGLN